MLRWWLGVVAGIADRAVGSTLERLVVAAPHPSLLVPHVHQVAILAIDMRGFSQLTRELDDSQYLADLISEYLTCLTTIVEGDRGVIFQYTGDGLLAAFLPEIAGVEMGPLLERLTRRMTPALHVAFERLRARWENDWAARGVPRAPIGLGIGLSVGAATIGFLGPIGKKQLSVIGEPVNTAAYLCAQASAGAVLIDRVSFETAGITPPDARTTRLRSKKPHQRIDVICLRGRTRTGWAGLMAWE